MDESPPGLIVAAPASGRGKTVLTLGILRYFRRRGMAVATFKTGPDYLDAAFLAGWRTRFPQAVVHTFPNAGHYVLEDAGAQICPLVHAFLEGHPTARAAPTSVVSTP